MLTRSRSRAWAPGLPGPMVMWSTRALTMATCRDRLSVPQVRPSCFAVADQAGQGGGVGDLGELALGCLEPVR